MADRGDGLVGRDSELALVAAALASAAAYRPQLVLVEGEPGIGKSALLRAAVQLGQRERAAIFAGRAEELRHDRPFGVIGEALRHAPSGTAASELAGELLAAEPDASGEISPSPGARHRLVDRVLDVVALTSDDRPVVLALDDMQWADASSVLVLQALSARLDRARLLIVAAFRPIPRSAELRQLIGSTAPDRTTHLKLKPLDASAVETLAGRLIGERPGATLLAGAARVGGNPFYLSALLAALRDERLIEVRGGVAELVRAELPDSVQATILRRLAFLPEPTIRMLRWAAVLGSSFHLDDLARAADVSVKVAIELTEPAMATDVLVNSDGRLRFAHDLVHDVVYRDIPAAVRSAMHIDVARQLAEQGRPAVDIAAHYGRGARGFDREAIDWLRRAGREVSSRSPQSAVDLLRRSLELTPVGEPTRAEIVLDLIRALLWSGRWDEADQQAREQLRTERDARSVAALAFVLGRALVYRARTTESIVEVEKALARTDLPEAERANLLADLSIRLPLAGRIADAEKSSHAAIRLAAEVPLAARTAYDGLALAAVQRGAPDEALSFAREALPAANEAVQEAVERLQPDFYYAIAATADDKFDDALGVLTRLRARTDAMGLTWATGLASVLIGQVRYLNGTWDDAVVELSTGLEMCSESGTQVWSVLAYSLLALCHARRGDRHAGRVAARRADELVAASGRAHLGFDRWLSMISVAADLEGRDGLAVLEEAWAETRRLGFVGSRQVLGPSLARRAARAGRSDLLDMVRTGTAALERPGAPASYLAAAMLGRAWATADPGPALEAAQAYASVGRAVEAAEALEDAAALAVTAGDRSAGRSAFERAITDFDRFGATADVNRVEGELRAIGVRRGASGPRRRPTTGWSALTSTEREVVRLVAEGLTNRQIADQLFISHRTVATHVSSALAKVSLVSRVEIAAAVAAGALAEA